jgi:PAS domain S-box-containing protein
LPNFLAWFQALTGRKPGRGHASDVPNKAEPLTQLQAAIVDMQRMTAELRDREARALAAFHAAPVAMHTLDPDGTVIDVSDRWVTLLGWPRHLAIGMNWVDFLASDKGAARFDVDELRSGRDVNDRERTLICQDGRLIPCKINKRLEVMRDGREIIVCVVVDETARQTVENALRSTEARFRATFARSPIAMHILSQERVLVDVSERWLELMGYSRDEVVGRPVRDFLDAAEGELYALDRDWRAIHAEGGDLMEVDRRFIRKDGSVIETVVAARVECPDDGGAPWLISAVTDVTARKQAEAALRASEDRLRQAQKMEAIGQLTGGVAHDFNNVLQAVSGNLELMRTRLREEGVNVARLSRLVDNALSGSGKAALLVQQLLTFARRSRLEPVPVDPVTVVAELAEVIKAATGDTILLETDVARGVGRCLADPNQLGSALLNLINNSRDAINEAGGKGSITISFRACRLEEPNGPDRPPAGEYVRIAVRDTGPGMADEIKAHAFEPFQTTKPVGKGTGLGLAMVYGFARQSGGMATVESTRGKGTEVAILLPRLGDIIPPVVAPAPAQPARAPRGRGETLLVVEDDEPVRQSLVETLLDLDYRVIEAANADTALEMLMDRANRSQRPHAVLTDMAMPGSIDGLELTRVVRQRWPNLPIMLMTGNLDGPREVLAPGVGFLGKPYKRLDLATQIRRMLEEDALAVAS